MCEKEQLVLSVTSIQKNVELYKNYKAETRKVINDEGIWLFLATLGCWSVLFWPLQFASILVALILFIERVKNKVDDKVPLELMKKIEDEIQSLPDSDTQKARLYDLAELLKEQSKIWDNLKKSKAFVLSWIFYGGTLFYIIFHPNFEQSIEEISE